jgi:hypothetical protein
MRKFHVLGLALIALFAIGVVSAAAASAVTFLLAEWLEAGGPITATLLAETPGEVSVSETVLGIKINALCSGIGVGDIGPDGAADGTELLNLEGGAISPTGLTGTALSCANTENCGEPLAWAINLPWLGQVVLMEVGTESFFAGLVMADGKGNPGYEIECMSSGLADTCEIAEAAAKVEIIGTELDIEGSEAFELLAGLSNGNCALAGNGAGVVTGLGIIKGDGTGALTVSSE